MVIINLLLLVLLLIVLSNLYLLGIGRLEAMISGLAFQGVVLSLLPLLIMHIDMEPEHIILLTMLAIFVKSYIIPNYLRKALVMVKVEREPPPRGGYSVSVSFGLAVACGSLYLVKFLPLYLPELSPLHTATAVCSMLVGLFLIASRRNLFAQIIGFLVFENGAFIMAISIATAKPSLVEAGIIFDLAAGMVMVDMAVRVIKLQLKSGGKAGLRGGA